jgi:hypothetical protein
MQKEVSIILPSIRPKNLEKFFESTKMACKNGTFEIIVISPYDLPDSLKKESRIKYLRSYQSPTAAAQVGTMLCNAKYIYNTTDDGLIEEDAIDEALEMAETLNPQDVINMIYEEGVLDVDSLEPIKENHSHHPPEYWNVVWHGLDNHNGIDSSWGMCMHFFMELGLYNHVGGYDCLFEYSSYAIHDLMFRLQALGSRIQCMPRTVFKCSHLPDTSGDHKPVNDAQIEHDEHYFNQIYSIPNAANNRARVNYENWKNAPDVWMRRFSDVR